MRSAQPQDTQLRTWVPESWKIHITFHPSWYVRPPRHTAPQPPLHQPPTTAASETASKTYSSKDEKTTVTGQYFLPHPVHKWFHIFFLNFHWRWRWWDWIQTIFLNLFYFTYENTSPQVFNLIDISPFIWNHILHLPSAHQMVSWILFSQIPIFFHQSCCFFWSPQNGFLFENQNVYKKNVNVTTVFPYLISSLK